MIRVTRLDGSDVFINENNIQWIESLPDTAITFLSGARILVKEKINEIIDKMETKMKSDFRVETSKNINEMSDKL
ncbi:flagellar FlbD family protein [Fluviispira multicolorata]|uniref:Flagellar protein FlbD n=1 Tax=Fluviispira multicolorata TaxID=2654512 RepID=A0A833N7Z7_9BACT|nr:flagellar FlbD family protein [Fluviispira multicolorata]KAB8033491.1 flagellar protein FlbD [Fluviispira multicolorata]